MQGIRNIASFSRQPFTLSWTASHPERSEPQLEWLDDDWSIHMVNEIAGTPENAPDVDVIRIFHCNSEEVHAALTPEGTWWW